MPTLAELGWSPAREAEFAPFFAKGLVPGRVSLEHNHVYRVLLPDGEVLAEAAGRVKHRATARRELPAVGDWVALKPGDSGQRSTIAAVLRRETWFSRKAAGRTTDEQIIAANINVVFLVFGLDKPVNLRAIERYLAVASRSGARSVVILNKSDLVPAPEDAVQEAVAIAGAIPVHAASSATAAGVAALEPYLETGKTVAFLGPSGVGKSSLVNQLVGEARLKTGEVRDWDQRGRHTSVHRELVVRPEGGLIVDTPGMRELQLWDSEEPLADAFTEIPALAEGCRFRDCGHDHEPGCAVKAAVARGELSEARYEGFLKLRREQAAMNRKKEEKNLLGQKPKGRGQR